MKWLAYNLFRLFAWLIALLPLRILYFFSWLLFVILYYLSSYRKEVVKKNLSNAFPEKEPSEIKALSKKFYRHLADMFIEGIKLRHMSHNQLQTRFKLLNPELINKYASEGRDAILAFGHYGNWEWIVGIQSLLSPRVLTIYKPLHNKYFDKYFYNLRTRYGMEIVPMSSTLRRILTYKNDGINTITALVADQTPPKSEIQFWTNFLNHDTPVYMGVEKLARKFNMVVFFLKISKVRRGYYEVEAEVVHDNPGELQEFELTRMHINRLEKHILEKPEFWLWSHRRWKHNRPKDT